MFIDELKPQLNSRLENPNGQHEQLFIIVSEFNAFFGMITDEQAAFMRKVFQYIDSPEYQICFMRDKAKTLENAAVTIQSLYAEMLQEVTTTANRMKGTTIETEKKQFASMQNSFDTIVKDIKAYSNFLTQAAEGYEAAEQEGTQKAQEQGKIF